MEKFKGTKGKFSDGYTGWKIDNRETNGVKGFEIHYSDDGECITDHVYTLEDAKLIASAPEMLEMLIKCKSEFEQCKDAIWELMEHQDGWEANKDRVEEKIEKIEQLISKITE